MQSESFVFLAFYVFDQKGNPIWFSCQLLRDANGIVSLHFAAVQNVNN